MEPTPRQELPHLGEEREDALVAVPRGRRSAPRSVRPGEPRGDLEVLLDGQVGEDAGVLGRVADAEEGPLVRGQVRDVPAPERDLPDAHREEPHDAVVRRRLPRAVSADEADRLAVVDGERDATEDLRRPAVGVDVVELEHRSRHGQGARVVPMSVVVTASLRRISSGVPSARIVPWCMATIRSE